MEPEKLKQIIESALFAAGEPLGIERLLGLFPEEERPDKAELRAALEALQADCASRGVELKEVGSGFRFQCRAETTEDEHSRDRTLNRGLEVGHLVRILDYAPVPNSTVRSRHDVDRPSHIRI